MSDWSDIYELWDDLKGFAAAHPGYNFLSADTPGWGFGFVASHPSSIRLDQRWSIGLAAMKQSLPTRYGTEEVLTFQEKMKTAAGRRELVEGLYNAGPKPRTRWDRLMGRA